MQKTKSKKTKMIMKELINEEEDWHENEVKDIQGKVFEENQFH